MNKARRFPIAMFGGDVDVVYAADYDKEVSDHNRLKEDTWALTQKLTADNERLRDALEHIRAMQLRGFLVLGDKANGLMKAAPVAETAVTFWCLYDAHLPKGARYFKKSLVDGSLAIYDTEEEANEAKLCNPGTAVIRVEYYKQPPHDAELVELLRDCYPGCGLTTRQTVQIRERIDTYLATLPRT